MSLSRGRGGRGARGGGRGIGSGSGTYQSGQQQSQSGGRGRGGDNRPKDSDQRKPGIVRGVVSGDTLLILDLNEAQKQVAAGGPLKEFTLTLLGLKAPQLGKRIMIDDKPTKTFDKPYAWESREYLRKRVIGKAVVYRIEHEAAGRFYGEIWLGNENIRFSIVENGWADILIRQNRIKRDDVEDEQTMLEEARDRAVSISKGLWRNERGHIREVNYRDSNRGRIGDDVYQFYDKFKQKELKGVVEQVLTGSNYRIYLTETDDEITLQLAGVRCPMYRANNDFQSEPFSREARFVAEFYLLHRDVTVTLDSIDKTNNLYGVVIESSGLNISHELLKRGYAFFVNWSATKNINTQQLRELEKEAQQAGLAVWSLKQLPPVPLEVEGKENVDANQGGGGGGVVVKERRSDGGNKAESIVGRVVEIVTPGTITVRVNKLDSRGVEKSIDRRLNFSSIKAPRMPQPNTKKGLERQLNQKLQDREREQQFRDQYHVPKNNKEEEEKERLDEEKRKLEEAYAVVAKEWLRTSLIGKTVRCVFDYLRPDPNYPEPRLFWSVYLDTPKESINIATALVSRGYATVVSHARDEARSPDFQSLIMAEKAAKKGNKGLHADISRRPIFHINDMSSIDVAEGASEEEAERQRNALASRAKKFLPYLKKAGTVAAVVEHVYSSTRYKLYVPSESCTINFSVVGCSTERTLRADQVKKDQKNQKHQKNQKNQIKGDTPFTKIFPPITAANRAMLYARDNIFQRNVDIQVVNVDKGGNFLGHIFIDKKDFALNLLETGNAKITRAEDTTNHDAALEAAEKASTNKLGFYASRENDAVEPEDRRRVVRKQRGGEDEEDPLKDAKEKGIENLSRVSEPFRVAITDIIDGVTFSYQKVGENTQALNDMMELFQKQNWSSKPPIEPSKVDIFVTGRFTIDDHWYRARISRLIYPKKKEGEKGGDPNKKPKPEAWEVEYIDYGNKEILRSDRLRDLPAQFSTNVLERQSNEGRLVYLKAPLEEEFRKEASLLLKELVWEKILVANQHMVRGKRGVAQLSLGDPIERTSINQVMVQQGLARVVRFNNERDNSKTGDFLRKLQEVEQTVRKQRLNIWQYGEAANTDDEN